MTDARIDQLARQAGIDVPRMRRAMNNPAVTTLLQDNQALAIDISGPQGRATPTFLVNGRMISGFRDSTEIEAAITEAKRDRTAQRASR